MELKTLLLIGHIIGVALGVGAATTSDLLFLSILKNGRIQAAEYKLLRISAKVVLVGLFLLMITGAGFILTGSPASARFWAKMVIVTIATVNGLIMHVKLFPVLARCAREQQPFLSADFLDYVPLIATAGPVSALSWYTALILGMWRSLSLSFLEIIWLYLLLLLAAVFLSNLVGFLLPRLIRDSARRQQPRSRKNRSHVSA